MKGIIAAALLMISGIAGAATYDLPDPSILVTPSSYGNTYVTIAGVKYGGPSAFYYVSECAGVIDSYAYRCSVYQEDEVLLTAADGSIVTVTLVYQAVSKYIRQRGSYYRHFQYVLDGTVTTPDAPVVEEPAP